MIRNSLDSVNVLIFSFSNEDISFAITQNGDLYAWGGLFLNEDKEIIAVDTPAYIASNIQDIAYQSENIFQLLQTDGKLIALDLRLVEGNHGYSPACTYPLVPGEVKTIYHSGVNMNNDSHWTWVKNLKQVVLMKRQDKIILEDGWFKVSEKDIYIHDCHFSSNFAFHIHLIRLILMFAQFLYCSF